ncbi:alpha/beta fold hydrolase [Dyella choica]|uniref:alpha/beta fold hydrolase n=1 Tax=Dyella choica TaxID=1927959 RepID=UPI001E2BF954|nr:alpha/beta fold hydrolase [Dyella choica]
MAAQSLPGSLVSIPTSDGYQLQAYVAVPQGNGPLPLVVMPSSWAENDAEYVGEANHLANDGFIVISYSSRGFGIGCSLDPQCGYVDIDGPLTIGDAGTVIDWALKNTPADANEIGISGISYGGGTSLLAAEHDSRIKAVAALSSWADLVASLGANQTPSSQGIGLLSLASHVGKPGMLMQQVNAKVDGLDFMGAVDVMLADANTPGRSASNGIGMLNANRPAVLLANAFEDSLFVPGQLVDFYNQLAVPKMLLLSHGDHTTAEMAGASGFPNEIYATVNAWFEHYLKGVRNGIEAQLPIRLKSQTGVWSTYADWDAIQKGSVVYSLTKPTGLFGILPTGSLSTAGSGSWQYGITGGYLTAATTGVALVSGALTGYLDLPPPVELALVNRSSAGVWTGPILGQTQNLMGMSSLQISVTPSTSQLTLIAYLYSVDPITGMGQLITWKPYTLLDAAVGRPQTVSMKLEATDWEIPAGHRLALVIDTSDIRYAGATPPGSAVTFSSSAAMPSTLTVSLH